MSEVYEANETNALGPIYFGSQQVEPQFLMAYILMSGPVVTVSVATA